MVKLSKRLLCGEYLLNSATSFRSHCKSKHKCGTICWTRSRYQKWHQWCSQQACFYQGELIRCTKRIIRLISIHPANQKGAHILGQSECIYCFQEASTAMESTNNSSNCNTTSDFFESDLDSTRESESKGKPSMPKRSSSFKRMRDIFKNKKW